MTDLLKSNSEKILEELKNAQNILMHNHPGSDGDSYGSSLGMKHILEKMGKKVTIIAGDSKKPDYLSVLPGFDSVLEQTFIDTDLSEFDLFLILDASSENRITNLGEVKFPEGLKTVLIDHHVPSTKFTDVYVADPNYISTTQMLIELLNDWQIEIPKESALCFLIGMFTDSGSFRYALTSKDTFLAASQMVAIVPDFYKALFEMDNNRKQKQLLFQGLALSSVKTYFDNKVAIAEVDNRTLTKHGFSKDDADGSNVPNLLKSATGWDIGISMVEKEEGFVNVSLRTRDESVYNLAELAALFGGGGHIAAAGAQLKMSFPEAKRTVLEAIKKQFPKLGRA